MKKGYGIAISVLGFREDESWCALGLEVSIRGYGETFEEACDDLKDLVLMQISFAIFKGQIDMIWYPADPVYFDLFSQQRRQQLADALVKSATADNQYRAGSVPFPSPQVISKAKNNFTLENA